LFIGEGEISRNTALGLTTDQVIQAFRLEMGVDEVVVWPEASFHLDYDVTFCRHAGRSLAFINEPFAAARMIVSNGLAALAGKGLLKPSDAAAARASLESSSYPALARQFEKLLQTQRTPDGKYHNRVAACFAREPVDSATANFQCFLTALDFLLASVPSADLSGFSAERVACLEAIRDIQKSLVAQRALLEKRGWQVVPVPSMPDLYRSVNYLNVVQDKKKVLMPAWGGFYSNLDAAAAASYRKALDDTVEILPLQSATAQAMHGSIHCMLKAYPAPAAD
jgi:hypothetical protein